MTPGACSSVDARDDKSDDDDANAAIASSN
jgi:hypothetical protein